MTAPHRPEDDVRRPPPPVAWERVRKVHLMGVGGSAMGALAGLLRALGYEVRGSDRGVYPPMSTFLAERGIEVMEGYRAENLAWGPDVVVVGNVIRPDYEEAVALRARGIPHCSLPQALAALVIRDRLSVVITGTHGKTTTSSLTAWLLETAGRDPAFLIGGVTGNFDSNFKAGAGDVFVVEGDEYDTAYFDKGPKFLHYRPRVASINNVEFDHADIFPDLDAIVRAFARFAELLPPDGRLVVNGADGRALTAASACDAPIWTFGRDGAYDVAAIGLAAGADGTRFTLRLPGYEERDAFLPLWGAHNVENALTASGLALAAGAVPDAILAGLATFRPPRKRLEVRGVARDVPVIDDFGHHPTAIRETLRAVRARYPGRRVLALFEVQSNTARRRVFQRDFADAFAGADRVWFGRPLEKASDSLAPEARL
ncbi:MAG: UDP-N-acetylmuramate dehydrogenase, partial [Myxococcales bacterium]|nr:UDP-N-acetylmuramate dehydrogenase [Myxococcales bacterium]